MSEEHREASRAQWSGAAEGWAAEAERRERGPAGKAADRMLALAAPAEGESVLELACGAGDVGLRAAAVVGPAGRVLLTDFAEPMVAIARERAADLPQVDARVLDAEDPQLGEERFDVVLCRLGYMLMPDPQRALRATHGLLRPGGRLALAVWSAAERNAWLSLLTDAVMGTLGAPPPPPGTPGPFALADHDRLRGMLEAAGFDGVALEEVDDVREWESPDAWWEGMAEEGGPVAGVLAHVDADQKRRMRDAALASARPFADGDAGPIRFPAALVVARAVVTS